LESGRSTHLENRLIGKYPLEAIHQTQLLSSKTGVAHALAAVRAIENYLNLMPTEVSINIRQVLLQLSTIHSHIHHFYWELLPDYLNSSHFKDGSTTFMDFTPEKGKSADLAQKAGQQILANLRLADLNAAVAQASANLNQKLAGSTNEERSYYQAAVDAAKAAWDQAKIDAQNSITVKEAAFDTAKNNLKLAEGGENIIKTAIVMDNDPLFDLVKIGAENLEKFLWRGPSMGPGGNDEMIIGPAQLLENDRQHLLGGGGPGGIIDDDQHLLGI